MTRIGSSDLDVFPVNLGGNVFGWTADRDASFAILDDFLALGGDFVDTADGYSRWVPGHTGGESEAIIGEWLASRGRRDGVVIATKVSPHDGFEGLTRASVTQAADASLRRLNTDRIDLYYAHYDDPETPIAETAAAFSALVDAGKIRAIGVSNYTAHRIEEWFAAAEADGLHKPVALQPKYNLVERGFERNGLRDVAEKHGLAVLPYYSLAMGFLAGKYRPGAHVDSARAKGAGQYLDERGLRVLAALDAVAGQHGVDVASVAIAWLRAQPTVVAPIASASRPAQLGAIVAGAKLELSEAEVSALTEASEPVAAA